MLSLLPADSLSTVNQSAIAIQLLHLTLFIMSTATTADTRNLEWKSNNIGSKLLNKMGWKEGQGIGKRRKLEEIGETSTEGLRVKKRADGLGLGAFSVAANNAKNNHHVADFSDLLASLHEHHEPAGKTKKKKKSTSSESAASTTFATNKSTHAKVRKAKFQEKTADDYKSIFAGADVFASLAASTTKPEKSKKDKKKKKKSSSKKEKA